jgi:peptide/nickel transport system substrate-binding protein
MHKLATTVSIFLLLSALLAACNAGGAEPAQTEPTLLRYALTLAPSGIDPHVNASSELGIPLRSVYDTLVYQDPETGEFVPGLAERWQISDDGLVYTFDLRRDVHFQDGTPFNAKAVRANLERITDPATASQKAVFLLGPYGQSEVVDDYTIRIHLQEPYAPLLDGLSQVYLGMASPAALEKWGADYQFHQVGTGPYKFVEYVPNDHLTLERNPDYIWGPEFVNNPGPASVDRVEFSFLVDPATRGPALESGDVDVVGEVPPRDAVRLDNRGDFVLHAVRISGLPAEFFLNTAKPPLDDPQVRQALLYATDRQAIVDTLFSGTSPVAYGPLNAATPGYSPRVAELYPFDQERAAALLAQAGWADSDGDGVLDKDGDPLKLIMALGSWGFNPDMAQLIQAQWAEIGIQLDAEVMPYPGLLQAGQDGTHHLIGFNLFGSDPHILWAFYHSQGGFSFSHATDETLDTWLDQAATLAGPAHVQERYTLYGQIQGRIMDQALVLPVRDYVNLNVARANVQNLHYDAEGWAPWLVDVQVTPEK